MASINRGDNTGAFGNDFLRIYLNNPNNLIVTRAVLQINGDVEKEYYEPTFPLRVNLTGAETDMLRQVNTCKLALWDEYGRRRTADGKFTFFVKENRINSPDAPIYDGDDLYLEENAIAFDLSDTEFACQFVVNATPSKVSELVMDRPFILPENIIGGENVQVREEDGNVIIDASSEIETSYLNLTDKPSINGQELIGDLELRIEQVNADWNAKGGVAKILNKPAFSDVAYTGNWHDIVQKPTIPTKISELEDDSDFIKPIDLEVYYTKEEIDYLFEHDTQLQPVYDRIDAVEAQEVADIAELYVNLASKASVTDLTTAVNDLQIRDAALNDSITNLNNQVANLNDEMEFTVKENELTPITQKLTYCITSTDLDIRLSNYATQQALVTGLNNKVNVSALKDGKLTIKQNEIIIGNFSANTPNDVVVDITVPTKVSDLSNDVGYVTADDISITNYVTKAEYTTGMNSKLDKTSLGQGILTIQSNHTTLGTFNANAVTDKTINISIPTRVSELEQNIPYITAEALVPLEQNISNLQGSILSHTDAINTLNTSLNRKLDKKLGFSLVADEQVLKLATLENYDDTELLANMETLNNTVATYDDAIAGKVDKVIGKGLSTNDFTNDDKNILNVNTSDIATIKDDIASIESDVLSLHSSISEVEELHAQDIVDLNNTISNETAIRLAEDNNLQAQIDAMEAKSTVKDIVATDIELSYYDKSILQKGDVICVLSDAEFDNTVTYYRWDVNLQEYKTNTIYKIEDIVSVLGNEEILYYRAVNGGKTGLTEPIWYVEGEPVNQISDGTVLWEKTTEPTVLDWRYIGSEGRYYTKEQADSRYIQSSLKINGHSVVSDINLTYEDVHALSDTTEIGNGTVTIQKLNLHNPDDETNRTTLKTFTLNQSTNTTVVIPIPTDLSDLANEAEFLTKDTLLDSYLGRDIPANTLIQDEIDELYVKVDALEGNLPDVALDGKYSSLTGLPQVISDLKKNDKARYNADPSYNTYIDDLFITDLQVRTGYLTEELAAETFALKVDIPTAISQLENDRGYLTINAIGRADICIKLAEETLGIYNANTKDNVTIVIPVDTELSTSSINPVQNQLVTNELNLKAYDNKVVHNTGNETVSGTKTINSLLTSTATLSELNTKAATTKFVDNYYASKDPYLMHLASTETITGNKTFTGTVAVSNSFTCLTAQVSDSSSTVANTSWVKQQEYAVDNKVVHNWGNETINGNKTFAETTTFQGITYLGSYAHVNTDGTENDCPANVQYVKQQINSALGDIETILDSIISGE